MANQGRYNASFWKKVNKLGNIPYDNIQAIMQKRCNETTDMLEALTPVKYGGLRFSSYAVVAKTPNGLSARAGYTQTPHWNLDPADSHQDDITNPKLAEHLAEHAKSESTKHVMRAIETELLDFAYCIKRDVNEYLRDYYKNGGI